MSGRSKRVLTARLYLAVITPAGLGLGAVIRTPSALSPPCSPWCPSFRKSSTRCPPHGTPRIGKYMLDNAGQQMTALHGARELYLRAADSHWR